MAAPPKGAKGHAQGGLGWMSGLPWDESEENAKLAWPDSIRIYDRMRKGESQLRGVSNAIKLPIRRTQWRINPNGAPQDRVDMLAFDLGLPIKGNDEVQIVRRRRFRWEEHIRLALLSLDYGHMPFEIEGEVRDDGKWHLVNLGERLPVTIANINTGRNGELLGIDQYPTGAPGDVGPFIPIKADSLVFYSHEREGSLWQGNSIFRGSYRSWRMKDRLLRVDAMKHERNGMGIPVFETQAGGTPMGTEVAQDEADIASKIRAGEFTGGSIPAGKRLRLVGVEGTLPDTIASVEYHDQQMAREALAQFLDLVTSSHGSRALATSLIDFFVMSLQATADELAATLNAHLVDRWHVWNWDDDVPYPLVEPGPIGDDHSWTAEGLAALVTAGAIEPDPELDRYLRLNFRMPGRDPNTPWVAGSPASPVRASRQRRYDPKA